ncbi:MAG: hypothetical protein A2020_04340 [Lentisphaerae bacterium GWF2_45_14]|nr:MAG: hypothetical protein A2020_04340 [Lentisphaerae bacterium GWF2_45_14]
MKNLTFAAVFAGVFVFAGIGFYSYASNGGGAPNITPSITTSRFLMFGAPYTVKSELKGEAASSESGVFRIDTYTGKVWVLRTMKAEDGQSVQKWQLIEDNN